MIVIIEDEVFASPRTDHLALLSLFQLGFEGRHRLQTDPLYSSETDHALNLWLTALAPALREPIVLALESGLEADASDIPSDLAIRIGIVQQPYWNIVPPRLPLSLALPLLQRPLRLLLENRHYDGAFLKTVALPPWRERYLRLLDAGWIALDHGGGLSDMQTRAGSVHYEEAMRLWALFDSDAREPGYPSSQSETFRTSCDKAKVAHHQLRRRYIESYLPVQALLAWANLSSKAIRKARRQTAEAFASMQEIQRHHYNMKGGFQKDRPHGIPAFYGAHSDDPRLQKGFDENIAILFHQEDFRIQDEWLVRDGQHQETTEVLQSIFRRL